MATTIQRELHDIASRIETFKHESRNLDYKISKIGTIEDSDLMRQDLQQTTQDIDMAARRLREDTKEIYSRIAAEINCNEDERRQLRVEAGSIIKDFLASFVDFQKKQREINDRQRHSSVKPRVARHSSFSTTTTTTSLPQPRAFTYTPRGGTRNTQV